MKNRKDLIKSPDYWLEEIQDELYRQLKDYMDKNKLSQNDIAKKLKVSKSYISQILNGNFNFTLKKLIELSLLMGKVPDIKFLNFDDFPGQKNIDTERKYYKISKIS